MNDNMQSDKNNCNSCDKVFMVQEIHGYNFILKDAYMKGNGASTQIIIFAVNQETKISSGNFKLRAYNNILKKTVHQFISSSNLPYLQRLIATH